MSKAVLGVEFVKYMMSQDYPDCPLEFLFGMEFLPDFTLESKRLAQMRVFQKWYLHVAELGLEAMPVCYLANDIYNTNIEYSNLTIYFEDIQFLFHQKRLDMRHISLSCM